MAEYIKKSIAIAIVSDSADMYPFEKNEAIRRIEDSAPADVAPVVHAKWVICSDGYYPYCSNCSEGPKGGLSSFCPHCGAKMDLEE